MPSYKKVDAEVMKRPTKRATRGRPISPEQEALIRRIKSISDESVVFEARMSGDEKPATVRQQLLRAAKLAGVEIAVKPIAGRLLLRAHDPRAALESRPQARDRSRQERLTGPSSRPLTRR